MPSPSATRASCAHGQPSVEPHNLGRGWVKFDYAKAFGKPVRIINDAAMQAIGSYEGGRMLFLGLGTGLGSAMILNGVIAPMELGHLPYRKERTYEEFVGIAGLTRLGKKRWREAVADVVDRLRIALEVDYVVLGGGNVAKLKKLPPGTRAGEQHQRVHRRLPALERAALGIRPRTPGRIAPSAHDPQQIRKQVGTILMMTRHLVALFALLTTAAAPAGLGPDPVGRGQELLRHHPRAAHQRAAGQGRSDRGVLLRLPALFAVPVR